MQTNIGLLIPEFILMGFAFLMLILEFFLKKGSRKGFGYMAVVASIISGVSLLTQPSGTALSGLFVQDAVSVFFKHIFLITNIIVVYLVLIYEDKIPNWKGEFYSLILFSTVGMMFLASSADFVSFYVSLELVAVTLYILAAFTRDDPNTIEAGLKYLVTGALSSGFLLYGISFVFGSTGVTGFTEIAGVLDGSSGNGFLAIGLALVIMGLTFKISSLPFHVWSPDVYQGAPTPVTALLAAGSKSAGFVVIMRILFTALGGIKGDWVIFVTVLSGASLLFGNLAAMPQKDIKRLIAYAGIGSAGYLLMSVAAATPLGGGAIMFYLLTYMFSILGSFIAIAIFFNSEGSYRIESFAGLSRRSPLLAATLFIGLLSIAGIPPLGGFIAKFYIIASAVQEGLLILAAIGVIMAIVAMYYFLLVVRSMYLRPPVNEEPIAIRPFARAVLYCVNAITILLGVYPGPVTDWVMGIAGVLFV